MNLIGYRLANQQLAQHRFARPQDVVAWLGAVQSQDFAAAKWGVGQRLPASTDAALDQAFDRGDILRTHVLRPTWHFVSPADIRWMLALTAPRVNQLHQYYYRQLDLDAAFFARSHEAIAKALEGGHQLTRQELASVLQRARLLKADAPGNGDRMGHIMACAELDGIVISGGRRGKQFTYALLDERAPIANTRSRTEALAELTTRYFTSRGPATLADFAWWSGLTTKDARTGVELAKSKLLSETADGQQYWLPASQPPARKDARTAYLLPNFDEYVVAYADRSTISDPAYAKPADPRANLLFRHTIVLGGRIAGTWKRTLTKTGVILETQLIDSTNASAARSITAAARRYGDFLGLQPQVSSSLV